MTRKPSVIVNVQLSPSEALMLEAICGETNISKQEFCRLAILHVIGMVIDNKAKKPIAKKAPVKKATAKKATRKAVKKTAKKKAA